jgi:hypothetical protein
MGALSKAKCATALWAVCIGGQVSAQTAPAILECRWDGGSGGISYSRISSAMWEDWDPSARIWRQRECHLTHLMLDGTCTVQTTDGQYLWSMKVFDEARTANGKWVYTHRGGATLSVDRVTGSIGYQEWTKSEWYGASPKSHNAASTGTCQKGTDPALQPKRAPPAPKM